MTARKKIAKVPHELLAWSRIKARAPKDFDPFKLPPVPAGVLPSGIKGMAMDEFPANSWASQNYVYSAFMEGQEFLGYPELSILAQRPEYRQIVETISTEATRKWIRLKVADEDEAKTEKLNKLQDRMENLRVRDVFREIAEQDGFFGRAHLYLDTGATDDRQELKMPIGNGRNSVSKGKVSKDRPLRALRTVEAVWTYPTNYNSDDPLKKDWYNPETWFVLGKEVHASRLLRFVGREVPDLLKPSYSFGGLSLTQMAKPYVDNWLRTRQSIADIIYSFSVFLLKTNLQSMMQMGSTELQERVEFFTNLRNNRGLMVLDKDTEDFGNVSAPLSGLSELQAQSQEHMAAVSRIPLVKLTGISPAGLNASTDGEIRSFYDTIAAYQEAFFGDHLRTVIDFIQLSEFGEVDPAITFEFEPLWQLDDAGKAAVQKTKADIDDVYLTANVVSAEEVRRRLASDENSPYDGLDADDLPDVGMDPDEMGKIEDPSDPMTEHIDRQAEAQGGANSGV